MCANEAQSPLARTGKSLAVAKWEMLTSSPEHNCDQIHFHRFLCFLQVETFP